MKRRQKVPQERKRPEFEKIRGENRRLRKEVARLQRELNRNPLTEDFEPESFHEEDEILKKYPVCRACGKGLVEEVDLGIKILFKCNLCLDRKIIDKKK